MVEGYCAKCKTRREIIDGEEETMNSGRVVFKGICGACGDEVVKVVGDSAGDHLSQKLSGSLAGS